LAFEDNLYFVPIFLPKNPKNILTITTPAIMKIDFGAAEP